MKKRLLVFILVIGIAIVLTGCLPGDGKHTTENSAGFLWGIWHGWIAPVSLIVGIFDKDISLFELNNTGWWYSFGFYIAVISGFGGLSLFRKKKSCNKED